MDVIPWWTRLQGSVERPSLRLILQTRWLAERLASSRSSEVDGRKLATELGAMLRLDDIEERSDLRGLSPEAARARVASGVLVIDAPSPGGVEHQDHELSSPGGTLRVRAYAPVGVAPPSPAIVYLHGGGWVTGSIETHDGLCRRLALGVPCRVVSVDYRLAPEHRFPAAVDDCVFAYRWATSESTALGIDHDRVALAGDSAGG